MLEFVGDAYAAEAPQPLTTELLDRLAGVMDARFATYYFQSDPERDADEAIKRRTMPVTQLLPSLPRSPRDRPASERASR